MIWIVCLVVALITTLVRALDADIIRHWVSFHRGWAAGGILAIFGVVSAVAALGVLTYSQLPASKEASALTGAFGAAASAVLALAAVRRYPSERPQAELTDGDRTYTLPAANSDSPSTLALGYLPDVVRFIDRFMQGHIRAWVKNMSTDELMAALAYLDHRGTPMFPTSDDCVRWRQQRRTLIERGGEAGIDARFECEENVIFRYSAYRVER